MSFEKLGANGNFYEYQRGCYRRLVSEKDFTSEEAVQIAKELEGFGNVNCYRVVRLKDSKLVVRINKNGRVFYLRSKDGDKITLRSLNQVNFLCKRRLLD